MVTRWSVISVINQTNGKVLVDREGDARFISASKIFRDININNKSSILGVINIIIAKGVDLSIYHLYSGCICYRSLW